MEDSKARPDDYRILGVSPQAGPEDLERAYHRAKVLYGESSLATYSMMDETERVAMRTRIEEAYLRASRTLARRQEAGFEAPPAGDAPTVHPASPPPLPPPRPFRTPPPPPRNPPPSTGAPRRGRR